MSRKLIGEVAMTASERSAKWWSKIKSDPILLEQHRKKRRKGNFIDTSRYDPDRQKQKAEELLRKVGLI